VKRKGEQEGAGNTGHGAGCRWSKRHRRQPEGAGQGPGLLPWDGSLLRMGRRHRRPTDCSARTAPRFPVRTPEAFPGDGPKSRSRSPTDAPVPGQAQWSISRRCWPPFKEAGGGTVPPYSTRRSPTTRCTPTSGSRGGRHENLGCAHRRTQSDRQRCDGNASGGDSGGPGPVAHEEMARAFIGGTDR